MFCWRFTTVSVAHITDIDLGLDNAINVTGTCNYGKYSQNFNYEIILLSNWQIIRLFPIDLYRNSCVSIVATCCQLSSTKVDAQCDRLATVVTCRSNKLIVLAAVDMRPTTDYRVSHWGWASTSLCTARRAWGSSSRGRSATADNLLPARRYDSAVQWPDVYLCSYKSVFYRNVWTDRTDFGMEASFEFRPILHSDAGKFS